MSKSVSTDLQSRIQTITDAFATFDETRAEPVFGLDEDDILIQLERLCAYRVPLDETVRTLVRKTCDEDGLGRDDLSDDLARLARYGGRPRGFSQTMLADVDEPNE